MNVARRQQAPTFLLIGGLSILMFMVLTRATVFGQDFEEANFDFVRGVAPLAAQLTHRPRRPTSAPAP